MLIESRWFHFHWMLELLALAVVNILLSMMVNLLMINVSRA